ncbi:hypothetical protein [Burkholderia dolosa]|uniref:hypothetical protein n=1 Tax=Burkholderia dolosa TaxID=152500 RepID=UPI001590C210|nr:hypothetical protein [Burkholderia dolosa]MBY4755793.1 hypothetical protein [Burkholderia dolosa]
MEREYLFKYYTKRWGHSETLRIRKTDSGWHVQHLSINGDSDKTGHPFLYGNFHQDYVKYPTGLGGFLEFIWDELDSGNIDEDRAQQLFDELGEWVANCEMSQPVWRGWNA